MTPNTELTDQLLTYYGELMHLKQECNDHFKRRKIERRMNMVNELLGLPQAPSEFSLKDVIGFTPLD